MSEYWVSKKKYYCKYCEIYIADDAPSRQQHENGLRHKGNLERFIRGIYKTSEKQKKDREEEKRDMQRVERAAAAAFALDLGSGVAKPSTSASAIPAPSATSTKPAQKPSGPYANYSTPASLGYTDLDAEKLAAELAARQSQGIAGDWQVVDPSFLHSGVLSSSDPPPTTTVEATVSAKRAAEHPPEEDIRDFKLRKRTLQAGLGEIYDPGVIPIKLKKEPQEDPAPPAPAPATPSISVADGGVPKWTSIQLGKSLNKPAPTETPSNSEPSTSAESSSSKWAKAKWSTPLPPSDRASMFASVKAEPLPLEEQQKPTVIAENAEVKEEEDTSIKPPDASNGDDIGGGSLFKRRRAPVNSGGGRKPF